MRLLILFLSCFTLQAQMLINPYAFTAPAASTLNTDIVGYWKVDEVSGDRSDSSASGFTLTDNNTVGSTTGKINLAAGYVAANSESLSRADNATLSMNGKSFTIAFWVYFPSLGALGSNRDLVAKFGAAGQSEYLVRLNSVSGLVDFLVSNNGTTLTTVSSTGVSPAINTWYHVVARHNNGSTITIVVNNGTVNSVAHTTGIFDSTSNFGIGARQGGTPAYMEGYIDEIGVWTRALSADEVTELYNAGNGKTCCPF